MEPRPQIIPTPQSSNVFGFYWLDRDKYNLTRDELHVFFKDKKNPGKWKSHYVYYDVTEYVYDAFFAAPSKGKFVHKILKFAYQYYPVV